MKQLQSDMTMGIWDDSPLLQPFDQCIFLLHNPKEDQMKVELDPWSMLESCPHRP